MEKLFSFYREMVVSDPIAVSQAESVVKYLVYFLPAEGSEHRQELFQIVTSAVRLLRMLHDSILREEITGESGTKTLEMRLLNFLNILNNVEIVVEMFTLRKFANSGRNIALVVMELSRVVCRSLLLLKYGHHTFNTRQLLSVERSKMSCTDCSPGHLLLNGVCPHCDPDFYALMQTRDEGNTSEIQCPTCNHDVKVSLLTSWFSVEGQRSSRQIQALSTEELDMVGNDCAICHKRYSRAFKAASAVQEVRQFHSNGMSSSSLSLPTLAAEFIDILTPSLRLLLQKLFGGKSFTPYTVSLIADLTVTYLRSSVFKNLKPHEQRAHKLFVKRLLLYLTRTPVFDKFMRSKLEMVLLFIKNFIPFGSIVASSAHSHMDTLQQLTTYQWSSG
eukprot:m.146292 g.146292  ORF g.146292 m.146292 type:complete len:389 (+) comp13231_c1_seq1:69-1235(+)